MSGRKFVPRTTQPVSAVQFWPGEWDRMQEFLEAHELGYTYKYVDTFFLLRPKRPGNASVKVFVGHWVCVDDTGFVTVRDSESFSLTYMEER